MTIDTEFSIAGAFARPGEYEPLAEELVLCSVHEREQGLGFLLDSFKRFGVRATFFVEALQTAYFGDERMGRIVDRLAHAGMDVQLHVHPCWLLFRRMDWQQVAPDGVNDSCAGLAAAELDRIIEAGLACFSRWGLPKPIAMRTGSLMTDSGVHRALRRAEVPISSSIGVSIFRPSEPDLQLTGGRHWLHGTLELPITSYKDISVRGWERQRTLTITGCSWPEMKSILWQARRAGCSPVVVLTHPFEFIKTTDFRYTRMVRNRVNQGRLESLLEFVRRHGDDFRIVSFTEGASGWLAGGSVAAPDIAVSPEKMLRRILENGINDRVWHF